MLSFNAANCWPQHIGAERAIDVRGNRRAGTAVGLEQAIARQSVQPSARRTITQRALLSDGGHGRPSGLSLVKSWEILIMVCFPAPARRSCRAA